jgi:hypothetical protein
MSARISNGLQISLNLNPVDHFADSVRIHRSHEQKIGVCRDGVTHRATHATTSSDYSDFDCHECEVTPCRN